MVFDIILVLLIALIAYAGKRKGLMASVLSFASVIMAYIASAIFSGPLAAALKDTAVYDMALGRINDMIVQNPTLKNNELLADFMSESGIFLADKAAMFILGILTSVIVFIIAIIVFKLISKMLNSVFKLPVLNFINSFGGLILGMVEGFMLTYILLAVWGLFTTLETPAVICDSTLLKSMFENNLLFIFFA